MKGMIEGHKETKNMYYLFTFTYARYFYPHEWRHKILIVSPRQKLVSYTDIYAKMDLEMLISPYLRRHLNKDWRLKMEHFSKFTQTRLF